MNTAVGGGTDFGSAVAAGGGGGGRVEVLRGTALPNPTAGDRFSFNRAGVCDAATDALAIAPAVTGTVSLPVTAAIEPVEMRLRVRFGLGGEDRPPPPAVDDRAEALRFERRVGETEFFESDFASGFASGFESVLFNSDSVAVCAAADAVGLAVGLEASTDFGLSEAGYANGRARTTAGPSSGVDAASEVVLAVGGSGLVFTGSAAGGAETVPERAVGLDFGCDFVRAEREVGESAPAEAVRFLLTRLPGGELDGL